MPSKGFDNRPIGIFDSGIGGLTVAKEIASRLPNESIIYFGDSKRCPYGPRPLDETRGFVRQICTWLLKQDVKLIVIACNTATAAGLEMAQQSFNVPVIGVVEPGARAAVRATSSRRVGVIATSATVASGAYSNAMKRLDAGLSVFSVAAPRFVEIAEEGLRKGRTEDGSRIETFSELAGCPEYRNVAEGYLLGLKDKGIDTLVMGCTHFPLLRGLIADVIGEGIEIISSAEETARDVAETLERRRNLASAGNVATYRFATTSDDVDEFAEIGSLIFGKQIEGSEKVGISELESLA